MNCAQRICVYAIMGILMCCNGINVMARDNNSPTGSPDHFQWHDHTKLSWNDFRGAVNAPHNESAAATYCGIGFKTNTPAPGSKPELVVYNTFYADRSWVRDDAKIQSILDHEQGHFDLCEIYTRKLKARLAICDPNAKDDLMHIYAEVSNEYEARQQAYEHETTHGTNLPEQRRWQAVIALELM